ncbi:MAG TPA: glycosyltransferase family 39 protein [Vicinamibacterales bacterium]|jgi:4-amino-4-deoxy-L-arabinose transferase-like glycosyltransferase
MPADLGQAAGIRAVRYGRIVAAVAVALYLAVTAFSLDRFPIVGQDEPWIAAPAYKLATAGTLGSDLFAGYHGMERHHFVHMPVYAVLEAMVFRAFGVGVVQMRMLSVLFGFALLLIVYAVGREVGGEPVAGLAVGLMVILRLTLPTEARPIGILLLDSARMNRYDIAVPVFGLAALWVVVRAVDRSRDRLTVVAGALAALSALSHLYGAFWVPCLIAFLTLELGIRRSLRPAAGVLIGFLAMCLPWLTWIWLNWTDYAAQMRTVAGRFDILRRAFYAQNVLHADGPISLNWIGETLRTLPVSRIGSWTLLAGATGAAVLMWRRGRSRRPGETALLVSGTIQLASFVALLQVKSVDYLIALWPLGALALAWLAVELWERRVAAVRVALLVIAVATAYEGGRRLLAVPAEARATSSYDGYERQIAACIPPGAMVLGFQHYWLGLRGFRYRTWLLPLDMANPYIEEHPLPLEAALDRINPDVVLIDRHARDLLAATADPAHPYHHIATGFAAFRARRRLALRCAIHDSSYATMEVYEVSARRDF